MVYSTRIYERKGSYLPLIKFLFSWTLMVFQCLNHPRFSFGHYTLLSMSFLMANEWQRKTWFLLGFGSGKKSQPCGLSSNLTQSPSLSLKRVSKWNRLKEENFTAKAFCSLALVIFERGACFATVCNTMVKMAAGNVYSLEKLCEPVFAVTVGHFSIRMIIPKGR